MKKLFSIILALFLMGCINGAYAYCLDTWVDSVSPDGSLVHLNNDTVWQVNSADEEESSDWMQSDDVRMCGDTLTNEDWEENVRAKRLQ